METATKPRRVRRRRRKAVIPTAAILAFMEGKIQRYVHVPHAEREQFIHNPWTYAGLVFDPGRFTISLLPVIGFPAALDGVLVRRWASNRQGTCRCGFKVCFPEIRGHLVPFEDDK